MISGIFSADSVLWTIFWQSTLFLSTGLVISFILKNHSARAHRILLLSIIASVVVPAMTILVKHLGLGIFETRTDTIKVVEEFVEQEPTYETSYEPLIFAPADTSLQPEFTAETPLPVGQEEEIAEAHFSFNAFVRENWRLILISGWIATSLILTFRLLVTFLLGVRLLSKAEPLDCERINKALQHAKEKLSIHKDVRLYGSTSVKSPVIWCWRSIPALVAPKDAGRFHERIDWTGVLCHELAHWKRRDHISGLIAELAACVIPWQIILWLAKTRLINLSEHACDDWVIATGKTGTDYAESLLDLTPGGQMAFVPAVVRDKNGLTQRVRRILKDSCGNPRIGFFWAVTVCIITCSIAITVAFAQTRPTKSEPVNDVNNVIVLPENESLSEIENKDQIIRKIYKLEHSSPSQIAQIIEPLLSNDGYLSTEEFMRGLIVIDKVSVHLEIEKIIRDLDKTTQPDISQQIFVVAHKDPVKLVEVLKNLLAQNMDTGSPTINHYESTPVSLIPWPEKNWIIVRAPDEAMEFIKKWITTLDSENPDILRNLSLSEIEDKDRIVQKIFALEHISPSETAKIIEPLLSDMGYLSAEDNTGVILVRDKVSILLEIEKIISNYDKEPELKPDFRQMVIFKVINKEPYEIIQSLHLILKDRTSNEQINLIPDPATKSLIVTASLEDIAMIRSWIAKLDRKDSYLPDRWDLYYDSGITPEGGKRWPANMAENLASLEILPRPIDNKDESWKNERFEFGIYSLDGTSMGNIYIRSEEQLRDTNHRIFQPGKYLLKYERGYGEPGKNYRMRCDNFILDMSQPGMYELFFAPKLGYGEISGTAGGCYAVNFEKVDSHFPFWGFAYINREKEYRLDGLPDGKYRLSAVTQRNGDNVFVSQAQVTIEDESEVTLDIAPPPKGNCSLTGSILGKKNTYTLGSPTNPVQKEGEWFVLLRNQGSGKIITSDFYEAQTMDSLYVIRGENIVQETSEKANYKINGIVPGEYTITVIEHTLWAGATITRQESKPLTIRSGEKAVLNFDLREDKEQSVSFEPMIAIALNGIGIEQITQILSQWTGKEITSSEEAKNLRITLYAPERLPQSQAIKLIYNAINHQGFLVEETEDTIYIKPSKPQDIDSGIISGRYDSTYKRAPLEQIVNINLVNADLKQIIGTLINLTGKAVLPSNAATDIRITVSSPEPLPRSKALDLIYNAIKEQGFIVSEIEDIIYIKPTYIKPGSKPESSIEEDSDIIGPSENEFIIDSSPNQSSGQISIRKIGADPREANEIIEIIKKAGYQEYDVIRIQNTDVSEVAVGTKIALEKWDGDYKKYISIHTLMDSKQILVFGKKEYRDRIKKLVAEIDTPNSQLQKKMKEIEKQISEWDSPVSF